MNIIVLQGQKVIIKGNVPINVKIKRQFTKAQIITERNATNNKKGRS